MNDAQRLAGVSRRRMLSHSAVAIGGLVIARQLLASVASDVRPRLGLCTFSCHRHWKAIADRSPDTKFTDAPGFVNYALTLGAQGVQTSVSALTDDQIRTLRGTLERAEAYYEGDVRLPEKETSLNEFDHQARACRAAGATVARTVLMSGRRYETFRTRAEFDAFLSSCLPRLQRIEPILKRHGLKLAVENHKDLTTDEFLALLNQCDGDWIGVNIDTGNNLALLEEPHSVIDSLAPRVLSVHLKDMAVQPDERGFLLSEVPLGTGLLDLPRVLRTIVAANPAVSFSLEMATRDPLLVPCLTDVFWTTLPARRATHLDNAMQLVADNKPRGPVPVITGKTMAEQLADEEANNRASLAWYAAR